MSGCTVASWPANRFLRRQVRRSGISILKNFPQFVVIHTVKAFICQWSRYFSGILLLFLWSNNVFNLISGPSAEPPRFQFFVHLLLRPSLENFEYYFAKVWNQCNYTVSEHSLSLPLPLFEIGMKTDLFQSCDHCWVFQICWHIECSTFTASSFRIWNSSAGIPLPPLALFIVMLPK